MKLSTLTGEDAPLIDVEITGITPDSREVQPGFLFAALPGTRVDGRVFIDDAVARGAAAILAASTANVPQPPGIAIVRADNPRLRLSQLAARFFGPQPETIVAVTGTNGKTSIATFVRQIWEQLGFPAASIGTLGVAYPGGQQVLGHTTPDPVALHRILATLKDKGVERVAMEASSHGLAQFRLDSVRVKAAGFTNLTRDHMDYHATFEDYRDAKLRLFTDVLVKDGTAVINVDGAHADAFVAGARAAGRRVMTVGKKGDALKLAAQTPHLRGQDLAIVHEGKTHTVMLPLPGAFQAGNALVAAGLLIALGHHAGDVIAALGTLKGAPGRLEYAGETKAGAPVFVDYAHTPDALENVLAALRPHVSGKLHVVFGCGGDRDPGKRPLMGAAAVKLADGVIVTDDNPRSENPALIRKSVLDGATGAREIGDRRAAIAAGVAALQAGDILVIAGKGHETGQIVGDQVLPFSDLDEAKAALRQAGGTA